MIQQPRQYFIHFASTDIESAKAGIDVCLAINVLELPLSIVINIETWQLWKHNNHPFTKQLMSLQDFEEVYFYLIMQDKNNMPESSDNYLVITNDELEKLKINNFLLTF